MTMTMMTNQRNITIRPSNPSGVTRILRSFRVEIEDTKDNYVWIGNLHELKNGRVEGCPDMHPCAQFDNAYDAFDYVKNATGSW
jgi:hypothetical protein